VDDAIWPEIDAVSEPYWTALRAGRLTFQACACGHRWMPPRDACPRCLAREPRWESASGGARLVSWVVYHTAYHPAFAARLPYVVAVVELDEGPRLIAGVLAEAAALRGDVRLALTIDTEEPVPIPRFVLA
jgi:uncharacterized OB-fold protein